MSVAGSQAIGESRDEIAMLNKLARDAPGAAKPLRQLLQTLDDRNRATENNPKALELGPSAPDPAAVKEGKGFTGFEAIWSYFYWQTLSLNQFDSISHVLRAVGIEDPHCSNFQNDLRDPGRGGSAEQVSIRERCNSYMGPNQPGLTAPDPTLGQGGLARTPAKKRGERRKPGDPEAGPLPGQVDYSKPQPGLSGSQQELLDAVDGDGPIQQAPAPSGVPAMPDPGRTAGSIDQALDYLLGP
jgi:hypothetical protein